MKIKVVKLILNACLDTMIREKESYAKIREYSDKIIVWLVGFSIAILGLLSTHDVNLFEEFDNLRGIVYITSFLTLIFGILQRIVHNIAITIENRVLSNFYSFITGYTTENNFDNLEESTYKEAIEEVKLIFKQQLGYSDKRLSKVFNENHASWMKKAVWISFRISFVLYILTCLSFLIGTIILFADYLF